MRYASAVLLIITLTTFGCKKGEEEMSATSTPTVTVKEEKPPEPDCPFEMLEGKKKFYCKTSYEVSYTNYKDYQLAGSSALDKRVRFRCRYERILRDKVWCKVSAIKYVYPDIDTMSAEVKQVLRGLRRGQRVVVDGVVNEIRSLGPRVVTFSLEPVK